MNLNFCQVNNRVPQVLILNNFISLKISVYAKCRGWGHIVNQSRTDFQSVFPSDPASFNSRGRKKFAQAIAICTKPASHGSRRRPFMMVFCRAPISFRASSGKLVSRIER